MILWKNNYAALKIIDIGKFLFYFIKIYFPVHFLFKWRKNVSACTRIHFLFSTCLGHLCAHHQENLLYLCDIDICRSVWVAVLPAGCQPVDRTNRTGTYQCRIDTISSPDDGHIDALNMYRI